jgi:hypothetical protein
MKIFGHEFGHKTWARQIGIDKLESNLAGLSPRVFNDRLAAIECGFADNAGLE